MTLGSQSCYESLEFKEIVTLVEEAIRHGTRNYTNRPSRKEIIYSFNTCIGVYCSFKNGRDDSQGYEIKELKHNYGRVSSLERRRFQHKSKADNSLSLVEMSITAASLIDLDLGYVGLVIMRA